MMCSQVGKKQVTKMCMQYDPIFENMYVHEKEKD